MANTDKKQRSGKDREDEARNAARRGADDARDGRRTAAMPDADAEVTEEESRLFEDHGVRNDSPGRKY